MKTHKLNSRPSYHIDEVHAPTIGTVWRLYHGKRWIATAYATLGDTFESAVVALRVRSELDAATGGKRQALLENHTLNNPHKGNILRAVLQKYK